MKYMGRNFLILLSFFLIFWGNSLAVDFSIQPIRIYMSAKKNTAVFKIENLTDEKTITVETEVKVWDQDKNGKFILKDTEDLIVVPPYIELKPKQKQLVKLAYLGTFDGQVQKAYRLLVKQIPEEIEVEKNPKKIKTAIQIVLHISVPVFINPPGVDISYDLEITPVYKGKDKIVLDIRNKGNGFARIIGVQCFKGDKEIYNKDYAFYILPLKEVNFEIKKFVKKDGKYTQMQFEEIPDKIKILLEDGKEISLNL
ncbi:fimbria/pilus periplasmic chaperone [Persephonella sp. IF05-L8]|uniref:fimbria/pilus periplasmic chaperone n=1 Tax=Persephonella sp. IF05-L8 TaxID=1158338 RepID=UPI000496AE05